MGGKAYPPPDPYSKAKRVLPRPPPVKPRPGASTVTMPESEMGRGKA